MSALSLLGFLACTAWGWFLGRNWHHIDADGVQDDVSGGGL